MVQVTWKVLVEVVVHGKELSLEHYPRISTLNWCQLDKRGTIIRAFWKQFALESSHH